MKARTQPHRRAAVIGARAVIFLAMFAASLRAEGPAKPPGAPATPPDVRELWVPADRVARVLGEKAVLLTRVQYEALLRDAGIEKKPAPEAPAAVAFTTAVYRAIPSGKVATIHAELEVNVLRDGWVQLPLDFPGAAVGAVTLDGEAVLVPGRDFPAKAQQVRPVRLPSLLMMRGRGPHRVTLELSVPVAVAAGVSSLALTVPGAASGAFTVELPAGAVLEKSQQAVKVTATAERTLAEIALAPHPVSVAFAWKSAAAANSRAPVEARARVEAHVNAERIAATCRMRFDSVLGDLPEKFQFTFAPTVKVLDVRAEELRDWQAADGRVTAALQPGERRAVEFLIEAEMPSLAGADAAGAIIPLPVTEGVPRVDGTLVLRAGEDVIVKDVTTGPFIQPVPWEERAPGVFAAAYSFASRATGLPVALGRAKPRLEADVDSLVEFLADSIRITRTVTLREEKARRFATTITLAPDEELLDVRRLDLPGGEMEPEWSAADRAVLVKWSDESAKPRVLRLRTRVEPEKWTQLPPEGVTFTLGDAKIEEVAKVTGYIALVADAAFRIEAQPGETLERRDGRATPVRGDYAWFRRDAFDLSVKIQRRPAEVLAALTGYALPLEGLLDLHATMNYQFLGGGTRAVRIRVPKELAQEFHFDGPGIAERALAEDVWTITFQKELTGAYALAITAQAPIARQLAADGDTSKGYTFSARVPVIAPLDVVRASGLWAVEANTETEIRFDAAGMNELDTLLAPQIPGYAPRHRVIGAFGWLGADYALTLNGVRHTSAAMLTAVVDRLDLHTVVSTAGLHRHEATYRLRAAGVEYLDVALPAGAALLSVAIDGTAVKPVANRPGTVRLPLPARRDTDAGVAATFVYETPSGAWGRRGTLALAAPSIAGDIPVLRSTWNVWVPDGFSFSDFQSNLPVPQSPAEEPLVKRIASASGEILSPFHAIRSAHDSAAGSAQTGYEQAVVTSELSAPMNKEMEALVPQSRGRASEAPDEAVKSRMDVAAANAARAMAQFEGDNAPPRPVRPPAKPAEKAASQAFAVSKTAGLLPVTLDLPKNGRVLVFGGLYAPERVVMRYEDWWSRARHLWMWFVGGGVAFYVLGGRRPWLGTLWAMLLLSAVPLCVSESWTPVCNALLGGWLAGLVLDRIGKWCVFRAGKEALA